MLVCVTSNHRNANFDFVERFSREERTITCALEEHRWVRGFVVLATCHRFEMYLDVDLSAVNRDMSGSGPGGRSTDSIFSAASNSIIRIIAEAIGTDVIKLRDILTVHYGDDAVSRHLFAVSSGLESIVVGEDEISGQVRRALDVARENGTTTRNLERVFQRATHITRGVKNKTAIGFAGRSLIRLALDLASSRVVDWADITVLIIGTGRYAATTVTALRACGAEKISVFSPSGRAAPFAAKHGLTAETVLSTAVNTAEIIVTCTTTPVLTPEIFTEEQPLCALPEQLIERPSHRLIIDLGLPRNVDPAVKNLASIELLDLETIKLHAPLDELNAHGHARAIIGDAAAEFEATNAAEPLIIAFRRHILHILDAEITRATSRGGGAETEAALRHLAGVLLHQPSVRIREYVADGRFNELRSALEILYGITLPEQAFTERFGDADRVTA